MQNFDHLCFLPFSPPFLCVYSTYFSLRLSLLPVRSDTVCDNTNTSFCHCHRANRLIGLPCYPTQTVTPKESTEHFHNVIDRVLRCKTAWKYTRTHLMLFACLLPQRSTWDEESQFEALMHIQHPLNRPDPHTQPLTHQNNGKKMESKAFWETGSSVMKAKCVL